MSVKELVFNDSNDNKADCDFKIIDGKFVIRVWSNANGIRKDIDRSQAHLLMLYLQEHMEELK